MKNFFDRSGWIVALVLTILLSAVILGVLFPAKTVILGVVILLVALVLVVVFVKYRRNFLHVIGTLTFLLLLCIFLYLLGIFNGVFDVSFKNFNIEKSIDVGENVNIKGDVNVNNINVEEDINAKNINVEEDINAKNINVEEDLNIGGDTHVGGDVIVGGKIVEIGSDKDPCDKQDEKKEEPKPDKQPEQTKNPTEKPTETPKPTPTPEVTPKPTPEEKPEEPTPEPTPEPARVTIKFGDHINGATEIFASVVISREGTAPKIESNLKYEVVKVNSKVYHVKIYIDEGSSGVAAICVSGDNIVELEETISY